MCAGSSERGIGTADKGVLQDAVAEAGVPREVPERARAAAAAGSAAAADNSRRPEQLVRS